MPTSEPSTPLDQNILCKILQNAEHSKAPHLHHTFTVQKIAKVLGLAYPFPSRNPGVKAITFWFGLSKNDFIVIARGTADRSLPAKLGSVYFVSNGSEVARYKGNELYFKELIANLKADKFDAVCKNPTKSFVFMSGQLYELLFSTSQPQGFDPNRQVNCSLDVKLSDPVNGYLKLLLCSSASTVNYEGDGCPPVCYYDPP
jgi:hypothetical protein